MIAGAILAGGEARRFAGAPKGLERIGGERIVDRLAKVLTEALGAAPLLVANAPAAESWETGLRIVPDVWPGGGALGGIYTAICSAPAPVVCVAWDMPFVNVALIRALAAGLEPADGNFDVCLPESGGRRGVEPMCAAYGPACRAAIEQRLEAGDLRAIGFHEAVRVSILPLAALQAFGDPQLLFFNVNTAEDLSEAEQLWRRASSP